MEQQLKRRSRTIPTPSGREYPLTPHRLDILKLLYRYRYLPTHYVPAQLGWRGDAYKAMLTGLYHDAGFITYRWVGKDAFRQNAVISLTKPGYYALKKANQLPPVAARKTGHEFEHELMSCLIRASFEIGAREHGLKFMLPEDILNRTECPKARHYDDEPWTLPSVTFDYDKKTLTEDVETDGEFMGLSNGELTLIFPGHEADRRTEPLAPEDYKRSSIKKKIIKLRAAAKDRLWATRYGLPANPSPVIIPVVTFEPHQNALMRMVDVITEGHGSGLFIFKSISDQYEKFGPFPPPTGHMIETDWQTVGKNGVAKTFNILDALKAR